MGLSYLFISHDLDVVGGSVTRIADDGRRKIRGDRTGRGCDRESEGGIYEEAGENFILR